MLLLYNVGLLLYLLVIIIVSPFNSKAKKWIQGRRGLLKQLKKAVDGSSPIAWVHCSSLGEFEQGRMVIESFRKQNPEYKILLTFFSPSGYEVRKNYAGVDWVFYLPLDTYLNARKFVKIVSPTLTIFVKYEFWYHYLSFLKKRGCKTYLVSAIFRPGQPFFKWYGFFFRRMLRTYRQLFVQNAYSKDLLASIGVTNVSVAGDTRFDRVYALATQAADIPAIKTFASSKPCIIAGSTWYEDEILLADFIKRRNDIKLVIAPHEVEEGNIVRLTQLLDSKKVARYTKLGSDSTLEDFDVLIIDTIGILMSAYRYGSFAYIGGGFNKSGIHNTLEAATFGIPVVFGPNYAKFQEANDLVAGGGGFSISNQQELDEVFAKLVEDEPFRLACGAFCKRYVQEHKGATEIILDKIANDI